MIIKKLAGLRLQEEMYLSHAPKYYYMLSEEYLT